MFSRSKLGEKNKSTLWSCHNAAHTVHGSIVFRIEHRACFSDLPVSKSSVGTVVIDRRRLSYRECGETRDRWQTKGDIPVGKTKIMFNDIAPVYNTSS